jgi:hypothetical protein
LRPRLGWLVFFGCFSLLYALGSNNILSVTTSVSSFYVYIGFWVFQALGAKTKVWKRQTLGLAIMGQALAAAILVMAWAHPYRQTSPLWTFGAEAKAPIDGGSLKFPSLMASFLKQWYAATASAGFLPQTPVIDMTGSIPGASFLIGGYLPKTPWIFSGYAGSGDMAVLALKKLSCEELARAWLIVDVQGNGNMGTDKLSQAGVDFEDEYALLGQARYPVWDYQVMGGVLRPLGLLAPRRNIFERVKVCQDRREAEFQEQM